MTGYLRFRDARQLPPADHQRILSFHL